MFRVLLPVDSDTERSLGAAKAVVGLPAAAEEIEVTILNVEKKIDVSDGGGHVTSDNWYDESDVPESVEAVKELLEAEGVTSELRRAHADPSEAIVELADEIQADQIVMAGRKRTPTGKVLFGSVTQSVLLDADIPVTVVMK